MPKQIPFPTKANKPAPEETDLASTQLDSTPEVGFTPNFSKLKETKPEATPEIETVPDITPEKETTPDPTPQKEEMPSDLNMENVVCICGQNIEIKPTKVKYFRNKTTSCYGYLKVVPLHEFLSYDKGVLDKNKDADQLLYDFLVAAFDSSEFVRSNYDEMTADDIERIIKIFGRINHIDEKEEAARKNREAQAAKH